LVALRRHSVAIYLKAITLDSCTWLHEYISHCIISGIDYCTKTVGKYEEKKADSALLAPKDNKNRRERDMKYDLFVRKSSPS
jgi:hypothetical protein